MKKSFYKRNNESFFSGKKAVTTKDIYNGAGHLIPKGSEVTLNYKCGGRGGFAITYNPTKNPKEWISVSQVEPEALNLVEGPEKYNT